MLPLLLPKSWLEWRRGSALGPSGGGLKLPGHPKLTSSSPPTSNCIGPSSARRGRHEDGGVLLPPHVLPNTDMCVLQRYWVFSRVPSDEKVGFGEWFELAVKCMCFRDTNMFSYDRMNC